VRREEKVHALLCSRRREGREAIYYLTSGERGTNLHLACPTEKRIATGSKDHCGRKKGSSS